MKCQSAKHVELVAGSVGQVVEVEKDGVLWDTSARARVMVDVSKRLQRVQSFFTKKGTALVEIKYERLPTY